MSSKIVIYFFGIFDFRIVCKALSTLVIEIQKHASKGVGKVSV